MNQRYSQNITRVSEDVSLIVKNVTSDKNGTMTSANVSVKSQ